MPAIYFHNHHLIFMIVKHFAENNDIAAQSGHYLCDSKRGCLGHFSFGAEERVAFQRLISDDVDDDGDDEDTGDDDDHDGDNDGPVCGMM